MRKVARQLLKGALVILALSGTLVAQHAKAKDEGASLDLAEAAADSRIIYKIAPEYPDIARKGHIEGPVSVRILVNTEGAVQKMTPLKGNPFLLIAAMNAVQKWRYRPYVLNGAAVEFQSIVTVKFSL
jgi:periplasmic protein TonB